MLWGKVNSLPFFEQTLEIAVLLRKKEKTAFGW